MKNKQANLSRRSVLGGSLAALSASPAVATAAVPGGDDSALLAMGQEWREAWGRLLVLYRQAEEAEERYDEAVREAVAELHELEGRIVRTRAKTPKGMLVKARMAALDPTTLSTVDDLEQRQF